jgi:hypothetical protein
LLAWIREDPAVAEKISVDDVYAMLLVLGRVKNPEHRHLLEGSLDLKDALTVSLVLEILCVEWQCTAEYLERVLNFALGAAWDKEEDVRHVAFKILGEHMFQVLAPEGNDAKRKVPGAKEIRVVELLLNVFEDASQEQFTRQAAYFALCRSAGMDWELIPSEFRTLDCARGSADIDWKMIDSFRQTVAANPPPFTTSFVSGVR